MSFWGEPEKYFGNLGNFLSPIRALKMEQKRRSDALVLRLMVVFIQVKDSRNWVDLSFQICIRELRSINSGSNASSGSSLESNVLVISELLQFSVIPM